MIKIYQKDKKKRQNVEKQETNKIILKSIFNNSNLPETTRWKSNTRLIKIEKDSSKTRVVNFCIIGHRKKKISNKFSFSRLTFLKLVRFGNLAGFRKSTW